MNVSCLQAVFYPYTKNMARPYLVFGKLVGFTRGGQVPDPDGLVIREADDGLPVGQKLGPMRRIFMAFKSPQEGLGRDAEKPNFAVVAADAQELAVGSESSTVSGLTELGQALVHLVGERVEDLDLECHLYEYQIGISGAFKRYIQEL